jgi:chemotaxis protein methyltransferase CheR
MSDAELSARVFTILAALVESRLGLHYGEGERDLFASKVAERMAHAGFASGLDYYYSLRYDEGSTREFEALASALLVGETYFFRERAPLEAAIEYVVRPALAQRGKARVLSAGCSTGEEPLGLAMLLADRGFDDRVEIVGIDANPAALERARAGRYGERSMRAQAARATRWIRRDGDAYEVDPAIRARVRFERANLVEPASLAHLGAFDLILCRNVLIYFRDDTIARVVATLTEHLAPRGRLLVGASESLLRLGTRFRCEERGGAFFYAPEAA